MDPREIFHERAEFCLRLAQATTSQDKLILIEMAHAWQQIADRAPTLVHFVEHVIHTSDQQTSDDRIEESKWDQNHGPSNMSDR